MINLVKNELNKTFKKKSMMVLLVIILLFIVLTNFIYHTFYNEDGIMNEKSYEEDIAYYEKSLKGLNLSNEDDLNDYITYKTEIEVIKLSQEYKNDSWQSFVIKNNISDLISEINYYTYKVNKDNTKLKELKAKKNKMIKKLENNDWQSFVKNELKEESNSLKEKEILLSKEKNKTKKVNLIKEISIIKLNIEALNYRLDKNISYDKSYLNTALEKYYNFKKEELDYNEKKASYKEKRAFNNSLTEMAKNKYTLDHEQNILNERNTRGILGNLFSEYEMIMVVAIIMISGSIVSEEFSKGTIKLLLIRPHSRIKILTSKLISCFISILIVFAAIVILQLIVGGIFFGFSSLSLPIVIYNFSNKSIETYNVFIYLLILLLAHLPKYILLVTLAFCISTIFKNTALATTIGILGYISSEVINLVVINKNIEQFKIFVTLNWNIEQYLFGNLPEFSYVTLPFSIFICIIYFVIMLIPTYIIFNKTNIRNTQ